MERVEGFKKFNVGKITETFAFDSIGDFKVHGEGGGFKLKMTIGNEPQKDVTTQGRVQVTFDQRDRKAVADLFHKMADSLDAPSIGHYVGTIESYDEKSGLNSVKVGDEVLSNLRVVGNEKAGFKPGERVLVFRSGTQYYLVKNAVKIA